MKILQVLDCFSPLGGGVSSVVYKLARALKERGHEVSIYATDFRARKEYTESLDGVRVHLFRSLLNLGGLHVAPGVFREVRKSIGSFDLVHFHTYTTFVNIAIARYAAKYDVPYLLDVHGNLPGTDDRGRKKLFHLLFGRKILFGARKLIAETELGRQEYLNLGAPSDKIVIVPPGFDTGDLADLPARGGLRDKLGITARHIVLYLGRIHQIKGLDFLMEGFGELARSRADVVLVVAGPDDGFQADLGRMAAERHLTERVIFAGFLSVEDKKAALVDADVLVQPSRYEQGIALTTLEALACRTPIIVTEGTGAAEDVRRMEAGYFVQFGDREGLCRQINEVLDNPGAARARATQGRTFIENEMSVNLGTSKYEQLYRMCSREGHRGD